MDLLQRGGSLGLFQHPPAQAEHQSRTNKAGALQPLLTEQIRLDDPLDAGTGEAGDLRAEVLVQAPSGVVRLHAELDLDEALLCFQRIHRRHPDRIRRGFSSAAFSRRSIAPGQAWKWKQSRATNARRLNGA